MFRIQTRNSISDVIRNHLSGDNFLLDVEGDCEGILVRSADLNKEELPANLLAIARAGAGYNNIPVERCSECGVAVFNTPGANANAVKELVICGLLLAGRKIIPAVDWLEQEKAAGTTGLDKLVEKAKNQFIGPELAGKTLGVIGLGAIGVMVANAASKGLDMEVLGYDPYMSVDAAWHVTRSVRQCKSIDMIFRECDYISLHLPLNDKTRGMIGGAQIALMKPGAVLLNFARGPLVEDAAVLAALEGGQLSRYITDFPNDTIAGVPGVLAFPHLGASTPESEENCAEMAARQLCDYLLDGNVTNSVNLPNCFLPRNGGARIAAIHGNITNMMGQMTALFAAEGHNIEHMINKSRGEIAYTIFDLDRAPSEACIASLQAIAGVIRVRVL